MDATPSHSAELRTAAALAPRVSVVIKALNEERHIAASISSALAALEPIGGEVILADSGSTDRTVEIARRYPITIVQLKDPAERRCGVGPQLGYQLARGEFIYILDGDMELDPSFLKAALAAMAAESRLGGVGGLVEEESEANYEFRGRKRRGAERIAGGCEWLDMGGLYRAAALREVGYFSNRNLHAYEEMDLGLRLGGHGWILRRLAVRGVLHHGRTEANWPLLLRRWRSGYLDGPGELLRAALGRSYLPRAAWAQRHLLVGLALWVAVLVGLLLLPLSYQPLAAALLTLLILVLIRASRTRNVGDACFGQVVWQVGALAMVRGFMTSPRNPTDPIDYVIVK